MSLRKRNCFLVHGLVAVCTAALLGGMAVITRGTLSAERERVLAESRAVEQENMRLALWRMDAAATAWVADEAQRPVISPPSKEAPKPEVKLRFEAREDGTLIADAPDRLAALGGLLKLDPAQGGLFPTVCTLMPEIPSAWSAPRPEGEPQQKQEVAQQRASNAYQQFANGNELANRGRAVKSALDVSNVQYEDKVFLQNSTQTAAWNIAPDWSLARSGLPRPAWIAGELFLLRHLQWRRPDGSLLRSIQGSWIDAAKLQATLLAEVADLFPGSRLIPVTGPVDESGLSLASFPWRFETGVPGYPPGLVPSRAVMMPLIAGWAAALIAIAAVWLLVSALMRLSEKRASFVSAVTHELRTPLTTFQLYSEMLESGAVKEEKRGDYFRTLRREAERLSHLVENVLAFSRIERGSARATTAEVAAGALVEPMAQRFAERLGEVGMTLAADFSQPAWQSVVRADAAAVEHVLFNLVDNAAKYAAGSSEVVLAAEREKDRLAILVRDHGPGIPAKERRRVFHAFHKSAAAAAESRPGVGLGLALSRRLARSGGGELSLRESDAGTCFALTLPLVPR